jgi:S-DNA-T family DNA segregation ATPase FtsK/SpoIIIE
MRGLLETQADRIEVMLAQHQAPGRVTGGTVMPRWVRFQVLPAVGTKISRITGLSEELAVVLDVPTCRVSRRGAAVAIEIPREDPQPVCLLPLFRQLGEDGDGIPPVTAVLGLAEDGAPLLIRLPSPDVAHVLVAGMPGSGKTVLLRAMILSLAMANPACHSVDSLNRAEGGMAMVLIDPKGTAFGVFADLPHLARPIIREIDEATEALRSLVRLMEKRHPLPRSSENGSGRQEQGQPCVVVAIDELADLLMVGGEPVQQALIRLTQQGREAGIHVVAATQEPTSAVLGPLFKANFPVRLVGRVASIEGARVATGWCGTGAERLAGRGDFLAVAEERVIRFCAPYTSPEEIQEAIEQLVQVRAPARRCVLAEAVI